MVVTGAPGTIATIVGAGVSPLTEWTLPAFEGNFNATWSSAAGNNMVIVTPVAPDTINRAQYRVNAGAGPREYLDEITISSDPGFCTLASCGVSVTVRVRVIVP